MGFTRSLACSWHARLHADGMLMACSWRAHALHALDLRARKLLMEQRRRCWAPRLPLSHHALLALVRREIRGRLFNLDRPHGPAVRRLLDRVEHEERPAEGKFAPVVARREVKRDNERIARPERRQRLPTT